MMLPHLPPLFAVVSYDFTVNLTSIITAILTAVVTYIGRTLVQFVRQLTLRMDILWEDYRTRHPEDFHDDAEPPYRHRRLRERRSLSDDAA